MRSIIAAIAIAAPVTASAHMPDQCFDRVLDFQAASEELVQAIDAMTARTNDASAAWSKASKAPITGATLRSLQDAEAAVSAAVSEQARAGMAQGDAMNALWRCVVDG